MRNLYLIFLPVHLFWDVLIFMKFSNIACLFLFYFIIVFVCLFILHYFFIHRLDQFCCVFIFFTFLFTFLNKINFIEKKKSLF